MRAVWRPSWVIPFRKSPGLVQDTLAVTPVVGTVMVLLVASIGVGSILVWGVPNMEDEQSNAEFAGILNQFYSFDSIAENVMHGGSAGKASKGTLSIPGGTVQRTDGNWFVISYYPKNIHGGDVYDFSPSGFHTIAEPKDELVITNDGVDVTDPKIILETVWSTFHVVRNIATPASWDSGTSYTVSVLDPAEFNSYPTRLRVQDETTGDDLVVMWFYPMGALEYQTETSSGVLNIALENAAVLTTRPGGTGLRDKPLLTQEFTSAAHPDELTFMAMFFMLFVDNVTTPGISAGGAGNYPLLFSLKSNNLRTNGTEVYRVQVDMVGARTSAWMDYYTRYYGFVEDETAVDPVVRAERQAGANLGVYDFVMMESLMELTLQMEDMEISTRPPPPPPGGPGPGVPGPPSSCSGIKCVNSGWPTNLR
ncbi:MAG: hypothetical protein KY455_08035 [Euryarchaeota archaeon]|nr:hypothetical protein [Euryarchaeota archaeon]